MAKNKLDVVLQDMIDHKDDGFVNIDDEPSSPPNFSRGVSPRKMVVKVGRRKRRRDDDKPDPSTLHLLLDGVIKGRDGHQWLFVVYGRKSRMISVDVSKTLTIIAVCTQGSDTYVMKLFDRSVDLAQFDEEAPLYPICRAWIRNQPLLRDSTTKSDTCLSAESSDEEWDENAFMEDDMPRDINKMPPPLPQDPYQPRAPPPVKCEQTLNIYQDSDVEGNQPEELLLGHMHRWKETRNRWREFARENEGRYAHSLNILRTMYERQMKDT